MFCGVCKFLGDFGGYLGFLGYFGLVKFREIKNGEDLM